MSFHADTRLAAILAGLLAAGCGPRDRVFDGARSFDHLVAQVEMGPRTPASDAHDRAVDYFRRHLEATADFVEIHRFEGTVPLDSSSAVYENVVASFNLTAGTRLCFGAHWDSRIFADQEEDEALRQLAVPGANDGASGVAVLLEVATALRAVPPSVGIDIVLFDGEDQGVPDEPDTYCLGSQRFVQDRPAYRPELAVILDMIGRRGTRIPREGNSVLASPRWVELLWSIGKEMGLTVLADTLGSAVMDDHIPFLRQRIPAVDLIDLDDPNWHTTRDLPENCAPESLEEIGRLVLELIRRVEEIEGQSAL